MRKVLVLLVLSLVVMMLFPSANPGGYGSYPPPNDGDWVIINETLVENETIVLNGNLTIENGGNLTLRNVTLKMNCAENGIYHIEVRSGGAMYITEGSNITSNTPDGEHRFCFRVREGAKFEMRDSELHECGHYVDYLIFDTKGLYIETNNSCISDSFFSNNFEGIIINNSGSSEIINSTFYYNSGGISLNFAYSNSISDCYFRENTFGVSSWFSNNDIIKNCEFIDNWAGTYLLGFTNGTLNKNSFLNNEWATYSFSSGCVLRNNTFKNSTYNFVLPDYYSVTNLDIDTSNTIDGSPIYVLSNVKDMEISPDTGYDDIGYLALFNSENVSIKNLSIHNNGQGLMLMNTSNSTLENLNLFNNVRGLAIIGSSCNRIINCNVTNNGNGIIIWEESNNNFIQNTQIINNGINVWFTRSSNNTLIYCSISEGKYGIWISGDNNTIQKCYIAHIEEEGINISSRRNKIYHNNFISNGIHAIDRGFENQWDDGKVGGNYWDDYEGLDDGSNGGTAGDGIGDTNLPHLGLDHYPFMEKDGWLNYIPTDTDNDGISDIMDIDDDNDGYNDSIEVNEGTDPLNPASVPDDYDNDFLPDSIDPDIDGDGFPNEDDAYPYDKDKWRIEEEGANWNIVLGAIILLTIGVIIFGSVITWLGKKKKED